MNNVSSKVLLVLSLLGAGVLPGRAQVATAAGSPAPCADEQVPARPTLKKRQTNSSDDQSANQSGTAPCDPGPIIKPEVRRVPFKFEGLVNVDESDLRHYIVENYGEEAKGSSAPSLSDLNVITALVKKFLEDQGYPHARVTHQSWLNESADPVFVVEEGGRPRIAAYEFKGNRVFSTSQLAGELGRCMLGYERDYYDAVVLEYCLHELQNFAKGQGYVKAEFKDPKLAETETGLVVTLTADEGILYRVGNIRLDGDLVAEADRVPVCPLKSGDVMSVPLISKWLFDDMKASYGERGYIQYTANVEPGYRIAKRGEGLIDLVITIDSGPRFKLQHLKFAGENLPDNLASLMLVHEGDIFNRTLFERSIETLNNTGQFEFINADRDSDFRENDEEGLLDIVIKLTRRKDTVAPRSDSQPADAINLRP